MNADAPAAYVLAIAVLFARIGGIFLIAPGLSSARSPIMVRVFIALGITLALSPPLIDQAVAAVGARTPADLLFVLAMETIVGFFIGLLTRLLLMAMQTMAIGIANMVGLGGIPGISIDETEPSQAAAALFTTTAVVIIFITDLHHQIIRAAVGSYHVLPPGAVLDAQAALSEVGEQIGAAFMVALRLASPFVIYSVVVNFAVGLTNKLTPQLPIFFVALPAVTAGGLIVMAYAIREVMYAFELAFTDMLTSL